VGSLRSRTQHSQKRDLSLSALLDTKFHAIDVRNYHIIQLVFDKG
jgi:hypothetical protein